jgi:hypothetical protein
MAHALEMKKQCRQQSSQKQQEHKQPFAKCNVLPSPKALSISCCTAVAACLDSQMCRSTLAHSLLTSAEHVQQLPVHGHVAHTEVSMGLNSAAVPCLHRFVPWSGSTGVKTHDPRNRVAWLAQLTQWLYAPCTSS